jgi:hypothetical protein
LQLNDDSLKEYFGLIKLSNSKLEFFEFSAQPERIRIQINLI